MLCRTLKWARNEQAMGRGRALMVQKKYLERIEMQDINAFAGFK